MARFMMKDVHRFAKRVSLVSDLMTNPARATTYELVRDASHFIVLNSNFLIFLSLILDARNRVCRWYCIDIHQ